MIIQSKSNLARLMATENIFIEQKKVPTAFFDLENRTLTIPILDGNLSSELLDLLLGHEVGHALETPKDGWHHSVVDLKVNRSILNVCEDARIEKKIKRKFPGIRYSFVKGYRELLEKDFFGVKNQNLNELNFIDRVNLYTKGGSAQGIQFSFEEELLLREVESTETFDEVVKIAQKIEQFMKSEFEQIQNQTVRLFELDDSDEDEDEGDYQENEYEDNESDTEKYKKNDSNLFEEYIESKTDNVFRENEKQLFSSDRKDLKYLNIPELNLKNIIIPYSELIRKLDDHNSGNEFLDFSEMMKEFNKFKKESSKVVSYLVKEFELRKNASQMARAKISKTGDINMNKIHEYKFTDDIFARMTKVPNGKSHGLVLFIDWSGSMQEHINSTIKQLLNIVFFCKKVNLPFEVYAFSTHTNNDTGDFSHSSSLSNPKYGDICIGKFSLLNLLSSKMTSNEYVKMCSYLVNYPPQGGRKYMCNYSIPHIMSLSGTPLNECIIAAFDVIPQFKEKNKVEIVNTVFLSDGDGSQLSSYVTSANEEGKLTFGAFPYNTKIFFRDTKTKSVVSTNDESKYGKDVSSLQTSALLKLLKERVGGNFIGFYIAMNRELRRFLSSYSFEKEINYFEKDKLISDFSRKKFTFAKVDGYDEYYFLRSDKIGLDDEVDFEPTKNTTRSLVSAFSKYRAGRVNDRILLNRFIQLIS